MLEITIRYILWIMFIAGMWLVLFPVMQPLLDGFKVNTSKYFRSSVSQNESLNSSIKYLERFLQATINSSTRFTVYTFLFSLLMIFIIVFISLFSSGGTWISALLWAVIASFVPVIFLYLRLLGIRTKTSHEGKMMLDELINNYRIYSKNIVEAIDQSIIGLDKFPNSKKVMLQLSFDLRNYRNETDLENAIKQMHYRIGTSWSILLANLIKINASSGEDILEGLIDISNDIANLEGINEKEKQLNIESNILMKFIMPAVIFSGFYMIFSVFDFTLNKYISYQFKDEMGFTLFFYTIVSIITTSMVYMFFRNNRNDY